MKQSREHELVLNWPRQQLLLEFNVVQSWATSALNRGKVSWQIYMKRNNNFDIMFQTYFYVSSLT